MFLNRPLFQSFNKDVTIMTKCDYCGKKIGLFETRYAGKNKAMHVECYEKYINEHQEKMEKDNKPEFLQNCEGQKKLDTQSTPPKIKHEYTAFGLLLRFCGTISAIICFLEGFTMTSIRSISGSNVAEAFYNSFGIFVIGLAFFILPLLFSIAFLIEKK